MGIYFSLSHKSTAYNLYTASLSHLSFWQTGTPSCYTSRPDESLVVTLVDLMKTSSKTSCSCFLNNSRWKHNLSSKKEKDESISIGVMTLFLCDNRAFIGKMSSWRTFTAREEITNIKCIHTHIWSVSCIHNLKKRWKQGVMHLYIGKKDESISIGVMSCIYNLNF